MFYPDDDRVVPLEGGQEFVPAQDLGLVQRPKAAEHFNITLRGGVRHDAARHDISLYLYLKQKRCVQQSRRARRSGLESGELMASVRRNGEASEMLERKARRVDDAVINQFIVLSCAK